MTNTDTSNEALRRCEDIHVELGAHLTTSISDFGWDIIGPAHISCWKLAKSLLSRREFDHEGRHFKLEVNWTPVICHLQETHGAMDRLVYARDAKSKIKAANSFPQESIYVDFRICLLDSKSPPAPNVFFEQFAEYYLHDFFLILNISHPASCNFYNTVIAANKQRRDSHFNLSNYQFDAALLLSMEGQWPPVGFLPLEDTANWFRSVRSELALVPKNRMERVLFAILHIAKNDISPTTLIWIFYALETLFDTKPGENLRALASRIQLLLSPNDRQAKILKKGLRELYNLRSAFVHGGLDVIHPLHRELLDRSVNEAISNLMKATDFGFQILLSSLQEIIRNGWREPIFREVLCDGEST